MATNDSILPYWKQDESIAFQVDRLFWFYDKMNTYEISEKGCKKVFEVFQQIEQAIILSDVVPEEHREAMKEELRELEDLFKEFHRTYLRALKKLK